jgi:hypothetical protein
MLLLQSSLLGGGRVNGSSLLFSIASPQKILHTKNQQRHYAERKGH